jgi:HEAT repeat protein
LAELVSDQDGAVREAARRALSNNPTKAAGEAIRSAIEQTEDPFWRGALVGALAHRRDPADAAVFMKAAASSEEAIRLPALGALARTGDASAASVLAAARETGSERAKAAAHDAYLVLAGRMAAGGDREGAGRVYREYAGVAGRYRPAGIAGLGVVGTAADVRGMIDLLADADVRVRGAALGVIARRKEAGVADEVAARLAKADAGVKPWLLRALVALGDARAKRAVLEAAGDENEAVRLAAIGGLARVGDAGAVPALLKSAGSKGEEQVAARNALEVLAAGGTDEALIGAAKGGPTAARVEALRALGVRRTGAATGPLFELTTDAERNVRLEAMRSLALVAEFDQLQRAIRLISAAKEEADRDQAVKTVAAIARRSEDVEARSGLVLEALAKSDGEAKAALLAVAGQLGGDKALAAVREAVRSEDEKAHEAGVRALAGWPDVAAARDLIALARSEKGNTLSVLSLRGYVRVVGLASKRPAGETVRMLEEGMKAARRPEERKMVLGGLGNVKDVAALEAVIPYVSDEAVSGEACAAAVKIGREVWEKHREVTKSAMGKVLEVSKNEGQRRGAKEVLEKIEPAGKKG